MKGDSNILGEVEQLISSFRENDHITFPVHSTQTKKSPFRSTAEYDPTDSML